MSSDDRVIDLGLPRAAWPPPSTCAQRSTCSGRFSAPRMPYAGGTPPMLLLCCFVCAALARSGLPWALGAAARKPWEDPPRRDPSRPQVIFCSRTHSQLSQFVSELRRTRFAQVQASSLALCQGVPLVTVPAEDLRTCCERRYVALSSR